MKKAKKVAEEAKQVVPSEYTSLDVVRKNITKKYGDVWTTLGKRGDTPILTISTGSLGLDAALGRGGLARGRFYEVFGPPSGGKTTLTMSVIAQAQRKNVRCVFVDAEHAADPKLFTAMGVDIDDLEYLYAFTGDDNLDALEKIIKTGEFGVAVVDSVSALIPRAEAEGDIGDASVGALARLMSQTSRKLGPVIASTNTLLIFINQMRFKITSYGDPSTTTGGEALPFYSSGRIKVSGGASKDSRIIDSASGEVIGHKTSFEVVKNKLACPFRKAEIPLIYGVGYDIHWECLQLATSLGIVDKSGAWYSYNDEKLGQGEINAANALRNDEVIYGEIRNRLIDALNLRTYYEQ